MNGKFDGVEEIGPATVGVDTANRLVWRGPPEPHPASPTHAKHAPRRRVAINDEQGRMRRLYIVAYLVFGAVVASQHDYYGQLATVSQVVSALAATAFWPLLLLGANLHLSLGAL